MTDSYAVFDFFNRLEAFIWFGVAVSLPFLLKLKSRKQWLATLGGTLGFILFGITDLLEAPTQGQMPAWLWASKITCAAFLLACRFTYIDWRNFRFTDRWILFAIACLAACTAIYTLGQK